MNKVRTFGERLFEFLSPGMNSSPRKLFRQTCLCNRLAKITMGTSRRFFYRLKDRNLGAVLRMAPDAICMQIDRDLHMGLLSLHLRGENSPRLHTHENWLATN